MKKKIFMVILSLGLLVSSTVLLPWLKEDLVHATGETLLDIDGHWAEDAILFGLDQNIISGYPGGLFKPNGTITRAEFTSIVARIMSLESAVESPFKDLDGHWGKPFVDQAVQAGMIDPLEYSDQMFVPNQPITRIEMVRMMARLLDQIDAYQGYLDGFNTLYNGDIPVVDYRDIQQWDVPYIALIFGTQIMRGYPDASFGMERTATRAEAAVMLQNLIYKMEASPESSPYLQEFKEISETGMNATTVSALEPKANILTDDMTLDHKNYTATLKRLYVIPIKGETVSMYERKFIWDRSKLEPRFLEANGYVVGVADVTFKVSGSRTGYTTSLFLVPHVPYSDQQAHEKFEFIFPKMIDNYDLEEGKTEEIVLYSAYRSGDVLYANFSFRSNNAFGKDDIRLLFNPNYK